MNTSQRTTSLTGEASLLHAGEGSLDIEPIVRTLEEQARVDEAMRHLTALLPR